MPPDDVPPRIRQLADDRAVARRAGDWTTADRLRDELEAAGWKVLDAASLYTLERGRPPDVVEGEVVRHGSSASVPSRLGEAVVGAATVVMLATDWPDDLARAISALRAHSPAGTHLVVVANGPSGAQETALDALPEDVEVVRLVQRLGHAAALNAGIRRAAAPIVILLDTCVEPGGDLVSPLVAALSDPTVAVAGPFGIVSDDLRHFHDAPAGAVDVDAIEGYAQAFRRADYVTRGPLDEHFTFYANVDIWWSLVLRDQGEDEPDDAAPRRAVRVSGVAATRHLHRGWTSLPAVERDRLAKKNFYRVLKRFATRRDLLVGAT